jgi:transaldolase
VPAALRNRLGIAVAQQTYKAYVDLLDSPRWHQLARAGARPQRLLFASTGTKDPQASDVLYVEALAAPDTIDTLPEKTLLAFAAHGKVATMLPRDAGDAAQVLQSFAQAGIDTDALATQLQREGADAFSASWNDLAAAVAARRREAQVATGRAGS